MVTLHAFLALAAGFVTMALLVAILTALLMRLTPSWVGEEGKPQPGYIFAAGLPQFGVRSLVSAFGCLDVTRQFDVSSTLDDHCRAQREAVSRTRPVRNKGFRFVSAPT